MHTQLEIMGNYVKALSQLNPPFQTPITEDSHFVSFVLEFVWDELGEVIDTSVATGLSCMNSINVYLYTKSDSCEIILN